MYWIVALGERVSLDVCRRGVGRASGLLLAFVGLKSNVGGKYEYEAEHTAPDAGVRPRVDDTGPLKSEKKAGETGENEDCAG